ncbi:hypothetical protein QU593_10140 [Rossellomorea marisflavi]|uniref:hypothetical protein n=1 Tax=Rossellomorea marisflavi TaxID=189381 RepID=UPI0025B012BA|nr:hypothetical protein [Rossellomorea marisflavi]WJV20764.1 hypothetical protein QU593_10140 [Rossellomorea marisflavi]
MRDNTKEKLQNALYKMNKEVNEVEVSLTYAEIKEFLLLIELEEIETKLRSEKLSDAMQRHKLMKS